VSSVLPENVKHLALYPKWVQPPRDKTNGWTLLLLLPSIDKLFGSLITLRDNEMMKEG
jgi:hypothetical protein